ncbi:hypothetical protein D0Z00_002941 [Geotrichum galactomycetum]|uniref:Uncharacterized protein n=1 Tax=Geotrichum galactomycetum TaxID=27317 RepID=A0ACB6V2P8_9ASCO|nr:hypothetical protein D0Z00_002941 [Geotrichum candidum]
MSSPCVDQDSTGTTVAAKAATAAAAATAAVVVDPTAVPVVATAAATAPTVAETNELSDGADSNDQEYALEPTSSYGSSSFISSGDEYDYDDDYDENENDDDDEYDSSGDLVEYLSDAQAEWEESIAQIQSLLTCILIPVVGKFFGRRFSYFGMFVFIEILAGVHSMGWWWFTRHG